MRSNRNPLLPYKERVNTINLSFDSAGVAGNITKRLKSVLYRSAVADHWHILVISKGLGYYFFIIFKTIKNKYYELGRI